MLKLERLDISGFKSFVDPVGLRFSGGMTAIVGPNGCGKSNLSDAITWVLGEQSAKSLRGDRMEDVIFAGTEQRKPLGMAEVTLTLHTDPSFPAAEDGRIVLGRRVFRSGESQYRLNGKLVRLKEIKDLLMDTGLGIRAYSVIEQGKIGLILSSKPQERRKLLEEAAGITRYKARRQVAEVKLEEARANLLRIDDVVAEVERALRSLKRQAAAARRYQQMEGEYRELLRRVLDGRWAHLAARLADLARRLGEAQADEARLAADLSRDEAALAAGRESLDRLAAEVADHHQRQADLAAAIEGRQQFLKANRERRRETAERGAAARTQAERRRGEVERAAAALAALERRRDELVAERDAASDEVSRDEEKIAAAEAELRGAAGRVETTRTELLATAAEADRLQGRLHQSQIEVEKGNYRRHRLERELEEHAGELALAVAAAREARERVEELEAAATGCDTERERVSGELARVVADEGEASTRRRAIEDALSEARSRQRLLAELAEAHAERRERLTAALAGAGLDEPEFLAGRLAALPGWERALDRFLADLSDAVLLSGDRPEEGALALADRLAAAHGAGDPEPRVHLPRIHMIEPLPGVAEALPVVEDRAVVLSLGEALGLSEELEDLANALPPAFLVEEPADAVRLARAHPGVAFLARGGVWAEGGLVVAGGEGAPGVLERGRELADLAAEIPRREQERIAAVAALEALVERRAATARELHRLEVELAQLRQEGAVARARREDAEARERRLAAERDEIAGELAQATTEVERLADGRRDLDAERAAALDRRTDVEARLDELSAALEAAKAERERLRELTAGRRGRLELLEERLDAHDRETARLAAEAADGERQAKSWLEEASRLERAAGDLEGELARAETELAEALEGRAAAEDAVLEAQNRLDAARAGVREREIRLGGVRAQREAARDRANDLRVERAGREGDAEHLKATYRDAFACDPPDLGGDPAAGLVTNLAELEADLARTKETLERLGPVNVLAVEEYAAEEERHRFLTEQRADVSRSVDSLKETIREINQASSERFRSTFAAVNVAFGEVFTRLFRGGEAEMRLMDEDDLLECGIEIVARPPGKRLQNLLLMSGGEKALTAIALLFALFRTKPSPFCILDEVDAPLDDVNTLRFVDLLREMAMETQILVVTHNKLTMEAAHTLYGVTMEEKGVSKLVAVELDEVHPQAQAASA